MRTLPITLLAVAVAGLAGGAGASSYGNADSIGEDELKNYLYFLASDQLEGRSLPSRGFDTAALYVASHLAEWGLRPVAGAANAHGPLQPYFMPMELLAKTVIPAESRASVSGARPVELAYGRDWTAGAGGRGATPLEPFEAAGNLVFAGNGYTVVKGNIDPYAGLDAKGAIVVVAGLPPELAAQQAAGRGAGGRGAPNPLGENCKDFLTPEEAAAKNGAVAVVTVANYQQLTAMASPAAAPLNGPAYRVPKLVAPPACPAVPSVTAGLGMANAIFQGEKTGAQQIFYGAGANAKLDSFALRAGKKLSLKVVTRSEGGHGENVIGILDGGDARLKNEYVVISAHLDHIGMSAPLADGHAVNNGADDDGSGSAALLAMARAYAEGAVKGLRPRRSVIFLWNAGEEKGLWGSQYFNQYPFLDIHQVVADLNMDMIGRSKGAGYSDSDATHVLAKPGEVLLIGPQVSSDDLEKTVETVNGNYQKLTLNHFYDATAPDATHDNLGPPPNGQRVFYRSDHYNFARMGIPIAFFTTGLHPDYHRPTDTPEKIDYRQMQVIAKTVAAVAWQLANQDSRPEVNAKLPDRLMKDMKSAREEGWGKVTPVLGPVPGLPE
jgi:Zn-dependent M28 family amino/carboxypeptidase